jgi:hypothetical protein
LNGRMPRMRDCLRDCEIKRIARQQPLPRLPER